MESFQHPKKKWRDFLLQRLFGLMDSVLILTILAIMMTFFARFHWLLELATHFIIQYFYTLLGVFLFSIVCKRWSSFLQKTSLCVVFCFCVYLGMQIFPRYSFFSISVQRGVDITLMSYNVHSSNKNYHHVVQFIQENNSDIVVLMEVNSKWMKNLEGLLQIYPYSYSVPREDNFGIMMLSKLPFLHVQKEYFANVPLPCILAKFEASGKNYTIIAIHPPPPMNADCAIERNRVFQAVATLASQQPDPIIICGDFNCTPYSPYFQDMLKQNLFFPKNNIQSTWRPYNIPFASVLLSLSIDHFLISKGIYAKKYTVFSGSLGSDHRPIQLQFSLEENR